MRSRSNRRIVRALTAHLTAHTSEAPVGLGLYATALVRDGGVVLAPKSLLNRAAGSERLLVRAGVAVAGGPRAVVIDGPVRLVVGPSLSAFDAAKADARLRRADEVGTAGAGTYELIGVALSGFPFTPDVSTAARTVQALIGLSDQVDVLDGQASLEVASSVARETRVTVVSHDRVRRGLAATPAVFG